MPRTQVTGRTGPRRALTVLLPLLLATGTPLSVGVPASAAEPGAVRLPVMPSRLAAGASCTSASHEVATATPWEQRSLELPKVWPSGSGAGVKVAVVDTGVSQQARALAGRVTAVGGATADQDCVGHGSFVAGLIAAAPVKGVHFAGVAQQAAILAVRGTDDRGVATDTTVAGGIRAAVDAGARIIEVSPALADRSRTLTAAVSYAAGHDALIVAAAVPDATTTTMSTDTPPRSYWPADEAGVLSVVAVDAEGQAPQGSPAPRHADLAAPGAGVIGIGPGGTGHFIGSGASLAAGYVAGMAALVRAADPELTAAETANRLTTTAYPADVPRLDPYAALTSVPDTATHGEKPAEEAVRLPEQHTDAGTTRRALLVAGGGGALLLLVVWASAVVPRGRARGWRAAARNRPTGTS
ncbi:S8 family serine peptidase [Streptomyces sp. NPDC102274]|uniref:S8 family serine peptidase n=1 Tax=Streptomyces sp. NPDC102274 TaxID=3366151 RepID=UPI0037F2AA36